MHLIVLQKKIRSKLRFFLLKLCNYFSDSYLKCLKVLPLKCICAFSSLSFKYVLTLLGRFSLPSLMARPERKVLKHHHHLHGIETDKTGGARG